VSVGGKKDELAADIVVDPTDQGAIVVLSCVARLLCVRGNLRRRIHPDMIANTQLSTTGTSPCPSTSAPPTSSSRYVDDTYTRACRQLALPSNSHQLITFFGKNQQTVDDMSSTDVYSNLLLFKLSPTGKYLWTSPYGEGTGKCGWMRIGIRTGRVGRMDGACSALF
jgi:hypothetical protein